MLFSESGSWQLGAIEFVCYPNRLVVRSTQPYFIKVNEEIENELVRAVDLNPDEASIRLRLARLYVHQKGKIEKAIMQFQAARRKVPNNTEDVIFAAHLYLNRRLDEAIALMPDKFLSPTIRIFLGQLFEHKGDLKSATSHYRTALSQLQEWQSGVPIYSTPDTVSPLTEHDTTLHAIMERGTLIFSHGHVVERLIAKSLCRTASVEDQIEAFRNRVRDHSEDLFALSHLGKLLRSHGKQDEEFATYRKAIQRNPKVASIHNLFAKALQVQGKSTEAEGQFAEKVSLLREAVRKDPNDAETHKTLARALLDQGRWEEACKELNSAFPLTSWENPFDTVGQVYYWRGQIATSIALGREAIRVKPSDHEAHNNLGRSALEFGDCDFASAQILEAQRLQANEPYCLDNLGLAQLTQGRLRAAKETFRESIRWEADGHAKILQSMGLREQPDPYIQSHLEQAERLSALQDKLDSFLHNQNIPQDAESKRDIGDLCRLTKRFAAASKFYQDAVKQKPALADELSAQLRLHAAISAAQAGTQANAVKDDFALTTEARAAERARALGWLRADLGACAKLLAIDEPAQTAEARRVLEIMTYHRDLSVVRGKDSLAKLPEAERKLWEAFWGEVSGLIAKADQQQ